MFLSRVTASACLVGLSVLTFWTVELGWSEVLLERDALADVERAARLWPSDAAIPMRLAELDPAREHQHLMRALELNPYNTEARIECALAAENAGDLRGAEMFLIESARRDKQFLPAWSLTNYYFRRGQPARFWTWARKAWLVSYGDPAPLFRLCARMVVSSPAVPDSLLAGDLKLLRSYFDYLLQQNDLEGTRALAGRILRHAGEDDHLRLVEYIEQEIVAGHMGEALTAWNDLADRKLIPFAPLDPGGGKVLTNPDFHDGPNKAFDWRFPRIDGVRVLRHKDDANASGNVVDLDFSGKQPYECEIGAQYLPLTVPIRLRLAFDYRTEGIDDSSGVRWAVQPRVTDDAYSASPALEPAAGWRHFQWTFEIRETPALGRLILFYRREPGTSRIEGQVHLRHLRLEPEVDSRG